MPIIWTDALETGVAEVDDDHRALVRLINELEVMLERGIEPGPVAAVIDSLIEYAENHFRREEAMLERLGYPDSATHAENHDGFGMRLGSLVAGCMIDPGPVTVSRLHRHLNGWLVDHILSEDMRYVPFVRARTGASPESDS